MLSFHPLSNDNFTVCPSPVNDRWSSEPSVIQNECEWSDWLFNKCRRSYWSFWLMPWTVIGRFPPSVHNICNAITSISKITNHWNKIILVDVNKCNVLMCWNLFYISILNGIKLFLFIYFNYYYYFLYLSACEISLLNWIPLISEV